MFNRAVYNNQPPAPPGAGPPAPAAAPPAPAPARGPSEDQTATSEKKHQKSKYDNLINMLVSAGYFRARIPLLSPFDKIVGGLCWCIDTSGEGVDVDILFTENSTIGQRIKLSEQIVAALRKMQCPAPLQAHQIQGSDFPAIQPVIVWLIKKFFETRESIKDMMRDHSEMVFDRSYLLPEDSYDRDTGFLSAISNRYRPLRKFRRAAGMSNDTEDSKIQACLFEYGQRYAAKEKAGSEAAAAAEATAAAAKAAMVEVGGGAGGLSSFEKQFLAAAKKAAEEEEREWAEGAEREKAISEGMQDTGGKDATAKQKMVGLIVGMDAEAIANANANYQQQNEEMKKQLEALDAGGGGKRAELANFKRRKQALNRQITQQDVVVQAAAAETQHAEQHAAGIQAELARAEAYNSRIVMEEKKLDALEASSGLSEELGRLKALVMLNETLKKQEGEFKQNCARQRETLMAALQNIKNTDVQNEEVERLKEIERMHADMMKKYNKVRQLLAARNQAIAATSRQIDDVPTRTELIQYERRFVELYEQVASKLDETRKYFNTYNTLDDTHKFLQKEVALLNSINDGFQKSMTSKAGKENFLGQFDTIIKGVKAASTKETNTLQEKKMTADNLDSKYQTLLDKQRQYFKAVKDFQEECDKNELLMGKFEEAKKAAKAAKAAAQ